MGSPSVDPSLPYRRVQRARWPLLIMVPSSGLSLALGVFGSDVPWVVRSAAVAFALVLAWMAVTFTVLTVEVDGRIEVRFGGGWPRRSVSLDSVMAADTVRNRWWYGWGIRYMGAGWLWNVSGLDAVRLELDTGRELRIGTDDPQGLLKAVRLACGLG